MTDQVFGQQSAGTQQHEYNTLVFVFRQLLQRIRYMDLVKVVSVTNNGGVSPVGFVSIQIMANQMTGRRQSIPHGTIYNIPYQRLQGGKSAIILDPQPGDIGAAGFCSRDISAVKSTKALANPGSFRGPGDPADGLYFGGFLNGLPTQYVQFLQDGSGNPSGVTIVSPVKITLQAPIVDIEATTSVTINAPLNDIKGGGTKIDGKPFLPHGHSGVTVGGANTGGVV